MQEQHAMYTREQIMRGLRAIWPEATGDRAPISQHERIDEHLRRAGVWSEVDLLCLFERLEDYFRPDRRVIPDQEQTESDLCGLFGTYSKPTLERATFGALAELIARRVPAVRVEPLVVFGRPCRAAGAFRVVERVMGSWANHTRRFPPSEPIHAVIRGSRLRDAWARLRWMSEDRLPRLDRTWASAARNAVLDVPGMAAAGVGCIVGTALLHYFVQMPVLPGGFFALVSIVAVLAGLRTLLGRCDRVPLPEGFHSVGDIARALASAPFPHATPPGE